MIGGYPSSSTSVRHAYNGTIGQVKVYNYAVTSVNDIGPIQDIKRPWYMHKEQDDNLMVLQGTRYIDIYNPNTKEDASFIEKIMTFSQIHGGMARFLVRSLFGNGKRLTLMCHTPTGKQQTCRYLALLGNPLLLVYNKYKSKLY